MPMKDASILIPFIICSILLTGRMLVPGMRGRHFMRRLAACFSAGNLARRRFIFSLLLAAVFTCQGADIFVHYRRGSAKNPGTKDKPVSSFARALSMAKDGDTIYILPQDTPINDLINIKDRSNLTIDGGNNVFVGTMALKSSEWKEIKPGFFERKRTQDASLIPRFFMVIGGKIQRMGGFTKAPGSAKFKSNIDDLKPGEWTILDSAANMPQKERPKKREFTYVVRLPEGASTLAEAKIEEARRIAGVHIQGTCDNLTLRNIIVMHFINDGFNMHGKCTNIHFNTIAAVECGDDGCSAHEACTYDAVNFAAIRCSTAFCNIQQATCRFENVYAEGILGRDIYMQNSTVTTVLNCFIRTSSAGGCLFQASKNDSQKNQFENLIIVNSNPSAKFIVNAAKESGFAAKNVQLSGYSTVTNVAGITKVAPENNAELTEKINKAREEIAAKFGGKLDAFIKE